LVFKIGQRHLKPDQLNCIVGVIYTTQLNKLSPLAFSFLVMNHQIISCFFLKFLVLKIN